MSINIRNELNRKITVCIVKYEYENYPDSAHYELNAGDGKSWERFNNRQYFAFVSDAGYHYGFLVTGGRNYSYIQQGKLFDFSANMYADFRGVTDQPGKIGIAAVIEDTVINFISVNREEKILIAKDTCVFLDKPEGNYWVAYGKYSENNEPKFKVEVGKSYFIAKGQVMVESSTNIIKKPWKPEDDLVKETEKKQVQVLQDFGGSKSLRLQGQLVIKNEAQELIRVAISRDFENQMQSNSWFSVDHNMLQSWGRMVGSQYISFILFKSVTYAFLVVCGKSYSFLETGKLVDLESLEYTTLLDINDNPGYIFIKSVSDTVEISLSGGNEGRVRVAKTEIKSFPRSAGEYFLSLYIEGKEFKYSVTSGYSYFVFNTHFVRLRDNNLMEVYKEAVVESNSNFKSINLTNQTNVSVNKDLTSYLGTASQVKSNTYSQISSNFQQQQYSKIETSLNSITNVNPSISTYSNINYTTSTNDELLKKYGVAAANTQTSVSSSSVSHSATATKKVISSISDSSNFSSTIATKGEKTVTLSSSKPNTREKSVTVDDLNQLLDPANLYCNEHKKLKKYYLRNEDYFLCEYDGYESAKNYCHFKDILTEYKDEVQRLKAAEVSQKEVVTQQTSEKLKTSVSNIYREAEAFSRFIETFQSDYVQRLEKLTYINSEILKIKDILSHINFRDDGSVNFINIGANEAKELKILTLANILVRRRMGSSGKEINFTQVYLEFLREFHYTLVNLARSSRTWIESSAGEIYSELASIDDTKFKGELNNEEFARRIYFQHEVEEIIRSSQTQIREKDSIIESLRSQVNTLNITLNERNTIITQMNVTINQNSLMIQENGSLVSNYKRALDELNAKYAALLQEKNALADKFTKLTFTHESLILEFNASKENFERTVRSHVTQIEEITSIKRRLEIELSEERNKYKLLLAEYEKLKELYDDVTKQNELVSAESGDREEEIYRLKDEFNLAYGQLETENKRLLTIITTHETTIKQLNLTIQDITFKYESALKEERNKYNLILIEFEKLKGELAKLNSHNVTIINETKITISNLEIKVSEYEKRLKEAQASGAESWANLNREREENAKLKQTIFELERKINELNVVITQLTQRFEISITEIRTLQTEILELNKEKAILMESEEKLIEENNILSDELEALKKSHAELLVELKAQVKLNEILGLQVQEVESQLKSESNKSEEITVIQSTKTTEFRSRLEMIIVSKEKLENELSEKRNVITHLTSEMDILRAKYEASLNEIASLKAQLKTIPVLEQNLVILGNKVDEVSNLNKNLESNLAHKNSIILQLEQEIKNCKIQNEELTIVITKHKESITSLQNYESKLNALENTRLEIEELKKKIKTAEELNRSTHRSGSKRRSRSIFNRSVVENVDKFGSVTSESYVSNEAQSSNNIRTITFPKVENLMNATNSQLNLNTKVINNNSNINNIQVVRRDLILKDEEEVVCSVAETVVQESNDGVFTVPHKPATYLETQVIIESNDGVFTVPHKPATHLETQVIIESNDGVFTVPHKPATHLETQVNIESNDGVFTVPHKPATHLETQVIIESNDGVFTVPHKPAIHLETQVIRTEIVQETTDGVFTVPHKPATILETQVTQIIQQSNDGVFTVPHKPSTHLETQVIRTQIVQETSDGVFTVPHKPATLLENQNTQIIRESNDGVFTVPHKPAMQIEIRTATVTETTRIMETQDQVFTVPHKPASLPDLQLSTSLLNRKQEDQISFWLTESLGIPNLGLKQLFKASRDGFSSAAFKSKCSGKPNTVTIAKTNYAKLIGGFTPIAWETPRDTTHIYEEDETQTSFLFSLTLNEKYPIKPSLRQFAVCNTQFCGPLFGGGSDLEIVNECNINHNNYAATDHTYASRRQSAEFYGHEEKYLIEDYEVYEVVRRQ